MTLSAFRTPLFALLALAACAPAAPGRPTPGTPPVFAADGSPVAWAEMVRRLGQAEVVFVGETHDDSVAHRLEHRLARELGAGRPLVVALEMFERDVQPLLDRYLSGAASEPEFLAAARPWRNYDPDYRPVVELARAHGGPVIASNVPRRIASAVARGGLDTLRTLSPAERAFAAGEIECPRDAYYRRFAAEMGEHPGMSDEAMHRIYLAQCLKDETMAEAVASSLRPGALTLHLNGSFHSDQRMGIVPRLLRRRPGLRVAVVSLVRAAGPVAGEPAPGDFVVYTGR